jgi:LAS superfamily LD-carboxypeptidase LdcB
MKALMIALIFMTSLLQAQTLQDTLVGRSTNKGNELPFEVQEAFNKMNKEAQKEGVDLRIVSGYRSYDRQQAIWNRKFNKYKKQGLNTAQIFDKIVEYSTVPGTSRHHWGTDLDIIDASATYSGDVLVPDKFHGDGPFCKMKDWMETNAARFGFELVYTLNNNRHGFKYEPWHYSYVPLSRKRYTDYLETIDLKVFLRSQNILGMDQIEDERLDRYLKEHVQGINPALKL